MAVIGTFGSFTAARLGIFASQASLNVTGNNIANINTEGYTRQRADLVSLYSYGSVRYANSFHKNIGYGVLIDTVSQLRDPFLDIRFREENASSGAYASKLDCLQQLAHVLDEVGKGTDDFGIVEAQFSDFLGQLQNLLGKVGSVEYDTTVRGSAQTLTQLLNNYAKAMDTLAGNKLNELKQNVETVNALLTQIRDLSVQIRDADIVHDPALELRDARNLCIDKLSSYIKIDVTYDKEKIDEWNDVERINITIADSNPPIKLIQGIYGTQISMPEESAARNPDYVPGYEPQPNKDTDPDYKMKSSKYIYYKDDGTFGGYTNLAENPYYDENDPASKKYMRFDPETGTYTFVNAPAAGEEVASQVDNAVEGSDKNRLWMTVAALTDAKGRYMRDENHREIKSPVELDDNQLFGSLQSMREFLTEKGEFSSDDDVAFDAFAIQKRGLPYYQNALDALARKFADAFNKANQLNIGDVSAAYKQDGGVFIDQAGDPIEFKDSKGNNIVFEDLDGNPIDAPAFFDELAARMAELEELKEQAASKEFKTLGEDEKKDILDKIEKREKYIEENTPVAYECMEILRTQGGELTDLWSFYNGGVLFSNNGDTNDPTNITARNITISKGWSTGDVRILNSKKADGLDHSTANDNVYHMIELMSEDMNYYPSEIVDNAANGGSKKYFTGSFQERLADMNSILGVETQTTGLLYNEYTATTLSLENSRQSVAGVDLNDEATNMMVFQKAYAAACQLMTTLDSMLDKLINGTIR